MDESSLDLARGGKKRKSVGSLEAYACEEGKEFKERKNGCVRHRGVEKEGLEEMRGDGRSRENGTGYGTEEEIACGGTRI